MTSSKRKAPRAFQSAEEQAQKRPKQDVKISTDTFRDEVQRAMRRTPRFLFRGWHANSGGNPQLNTIHAVTPLAFLTGSPASFFNTPRSMLQSLADRHISYDRNLATPFSSWSQSLAIALAHANNTDGHICILDTKQLGPEIVVLSTPTMSRLLGCRGDYAFEFLAHGVITGAAYNAVPCSSLIGSALMPHCDPYLLAYCGGSLDIDSESSYLKRSLNIARLFAPSFEIPIAAYICSFSASKSLRQKFMSTMSLDAIPFSWKTDQTIMTSEVDIHDMFDAQRAIGFLRELVTAKYGKGLLELPEIVTLQSLPVDDVLDDGDKTSVKITSEASSARATLNKISKEAKHGIPREVVKLFTDAPGWKEAVESGIGRSKR